MTTPKADHAEARMFAAECVKYGHRWAMFPRTEMLARAYLDALDKLRHARELPQVRDCPDCASIARILRDTQETDR